MQNESYSDVATLLDEHPHLAKKSTPRTSCLVAGMASNFRNCPSIVKSYIKLNQQHEKRIYFDYQKKYLSSTVPIERKQNYLKQKFYDLIAWYDEFTGMDEVRAAQRRVLEDEDRFRKTQEDRRKALSELNEVQNKLKDLYLELDSTTRGDEKFITLVTEEHNLLKQEKVMLERFKAAEKLERQCFTALSSSVKLSHEKERAQSERTKYWSIIGSVLGTVIGVFASSVNSHFKMNELKQLLKNSAQVQLMDSINSYLDASERLLQKLENKTNVRHEEFASFSNIEDLLNSVSARLYRVESSVRDLTKTNEKYISKLESNSDEGVIMAVPVSSVEESLKKEYSQTKMLLFTLAVLTVIMPIISRYS